MVCVAASSITLTPTVMAGTGVQGLHGFLLGLVHDTQATKYVCVLKVLQIECKSIYTKGELAQLT